MTYTAAGRPVSASFTGVSLWTLLTAAGLVTDPAVKNAELRQYVLATGSDGYEATFSLGELDPRFGGGGAADLVAYPQDGQPLGTDGFARLIVPSDLAGGRYVSNLVSLQVIDATAVPEPGSLALMLAGWPGASSFGGAHHAGLPPCLPRAEHWCPTPPNLYPSRRQSSPALALLVEALRYRGAPRGSQKF